MPSYGQVEENDYSVQAEGMYQDSVLRLDNFHYCNNSCHPFSFMNVSKNFSKYN